MYNAILQFSNNVGGSGLICVECNGHISGRLVSSFFCGQSGIYNEDFMFYDTGLLYFDIIYDSGLYSF